ncbi:ligand-binding sensor domain-containing protein [Aureitalea marina]|uniref:histidine kinase n=1 Tax=Aureitalea marina TaxID=930804 RepID=A0A2S7KRC2_9FLAO|nr:sensor histidine kinase [Aureitalea marina]PQB05172.1 hypothetical protein BST85_09965 [Aureitalea marina]
MESRKYGLFPLFLIALFCLSCGDRDRNDSLLQDATNQSDVSNEPLVLQQDKDSAGIVNHFGTIIQTGSPLRIQPEIIKKSALATANPVGIGVLAPNKLEENSIPFSTTKKSIPYKLLLEPKNNSSQDSPWLLNGIGDTLLTGVPLSLAGERILRKQLPRKRALSPKYKNTSIPFDIKSLDVTGGMLTSYVYCVFQDSKKRIWVGSYNGLSMYDGQSFTHYTKEQGLASNFIWKVSEDVNGHILIGTRGDGTEGGLSIYDGLSFTNISEKEGLPHHFVTDIYPDKDGGYWLGTYQGAVYYNGFSFTLFTTFEGLPHNRVYAITGDEEGNIYFGTEGGLAIYNGKNFRLLQQANGLQSESVRALFIDSKSALWIGSQKGVYRYTEDTLYTFADTQARMGMITAIVEDHDGSIWIASSTSGIFEYRNNQFYRYGEKEGLVSDDIIELYVDTDNHLWFASDGGGLGIFRHDSFSYLTPKSGIVVPGYKALLEDRQNNVWIGSDSGGASVIKKDELLSFTTQTGLLSNNITDLAEDAQGTIWLATREALSAYNGTHLTNYTTEHGLSSASVNCVYVDQQNHIWAGTAEGITLFKGDEIHYYKEENGFLNNTVNDITADSTGIIWMATNAGLARYDGETFTYYGEGEGLSENTINTLFVDTDGLLWIGTLGGGISTFDGEKFNSYTTSDGLSDNVVWALQQDSNKRIWATTEKGITVFTPNTVASNSSTPFSIRSYFESDGLPELSFFGGDALLDSQGTLWLSNVVNITKKSPEMLRETPAVPSLFLNRIELNDTFYDFNAIENQEGLPFTFSKTLPFYNLPLDLVAQPSQKQCSFFFSAIDWIAPHSVQFSHTIEELEQGWSKPSYENKADYRNLSYGSYTFKVKAMGASGIWSPEYTYRFKILPPWWHTWWARTCYAFLVILLLYSYVRMRLRTLKKRQQELLSQVRVATKEIRQQKEEIELQKEDLQEANNMKNKMFSVIAHDLRGPFGQLKMGLMLLEQGDLSKVERKEIISMLGRDHENTSALLDNLLEWSIAQKGEMIFEPSSQQIQPLVAQNITLFNKEAKRKGVLLSNKVPSSLKAYFDRNMVQTVLRNLISNAIKFTTAGDRITIEGKIMEGTICITVKDTGIGIPEEKVKKLFKKNKNFTTYGTDNEKGSGLGLELCNSLILKNGGSIQAFSVEGVGTTISFTLPTTT